MNALHNLVRQRYNYEKDSVTMGSEKKTLSLKIIFEKKTRYWK